MLVSIDAASERPIYSQIADSIRRSIACGELRPGERLPTASDVATGLGINKHTVLHAYQELRDEGLVDLRRGRGAVLTALAAEVVELQQEATRIAERARGLGISARTLAALFAPPAAELTGGPTTERAADLLADQLAETTIPSNQSRGVPSA